MTTYAICKACISEPPSANLRSEGADDPPGAPAYLLQTWRDFKIIMLKLKKSTA